MSNGVSPDAGGSAPPARGLPRLLEPRWRRVLVAGWVLFAVSFVLPALASNGIPDRTILPEGLRMPPPPPPPPAASIMPEAGPSPGPGSSFMAQGTDFTPGWEAFLFALLGWGGILGIVSALTNLLMLATAFHGRWSPRARWPVVVLAAATVLNLWYWLWWVAADGESVLQVGYYVWVASFACATTAFWLRARERATPATQ